MKATVKIHICRRDGAHRAALLAARGPKRICPTREAEGRSAEALWVEASEERTEGLSQKPRSRTRDDAHRLARWLLREKSMPDVRMIRCTSCGATNRVPQEKIAKG